MASGYFKAMNNLVSQPKNKVVDPHVPSINKTLKHIADVAPPAVHSESLKRYK